jgi:hypothetical protein
MNVNAFFAGQIVGGFIGIYLLSTLFEWALFKRVMDDPVKGKDSSVLAAWLFSLAASVYAGRDTLVAHLIAYTLAALVIGALKHRKGLALRHRIEEDEA